MEKNKTKVIILNRDNVQPNETKTFYKYQKSRLTFLPLQLRSLILDFQQIHISYEDSLWQKNKNLCKQFRSLDQDGGHAHIW